MSDQMETRVKEIIVEYGELEIASEDIGLETNLTTIGINSISFIKIIVAIESEFNMEFDDDGLDYTQYQCFKDVVSYIREKNNELKK